MAASAPIYGWKNLAPLVLFLSVAIAVTIPFIASIAMGQSANSSEIAVRFPLGNHDIVEMAKAKFDDSTIIKAIQTNNTNFDLSVTALVALKNAGVSQSVIAEMMSAGGKKEAKANAVIPAQPQPSSATPADAPSARSVPNTSASVEPQQQAVQDISQLFGKKVIVQRAALCQAGTNTFVTDRAGKEARVISLKPNNIPHMSEAAMNRLTPEVRATVEQAQKAATILVAFEDGTKLDTCFPVTPQYVSSYFELAPGESLPAVVEKATAPSSPTPSTAASTEASIQSADMLSSVEVNQALSGKGRDHWVSIEDMGFFAAQGNQTPSISLYMPEAVVAINAESSKKQFTHFEPSEEDERRSLMIVAEGYAGKTITDGCTSITRIVLLSDPSGTLVKEAYLSEPLDETWRNNFGATSVCQALRAKFSVADVEKVKAAAPNGEFYVAVFAGSVNTKMYKVKRKFQSKLKLN